MIELISNSSDETIEIGRKLGSLLKSGDVIAYKGTLAAGKTTLTKGIAKSLGIEEDVTSPTFTLLSEYEGKIPLYHMDVYRLNGTDDFINLGAEELIYGNGVSIIEWSEKIMDSLPKKAIIIRLEPQESADGCRRKITLENWPYGDF